MLARWLEHQWQSHGLVPWLLQPLCWLFALVTAIRRLAYRRGLLRSVCLPVPVIIVGNVSVGGVGKTPVVLAVVNALRAAGYQPGILSRGYGARQSGLVTANSDPTQLGDEPVLLAQRSGCLVSVHPDRVAAGSVLLTAMPGCDVLICDDGLQHYRLQRNIEIAVVRRPEGIGNGHVLPAGPLREPLSRLQSVDLVIESGDLPVNQTTIPCYFLHLQPGPWTAVHNEACHTDAAHLKTQPLVAVAGIAHPQRFFERLHAMGLVFETQVFADHHAYSQADFARFAGKTLLMTEKDAVKCRRLHLPQAWYLPVQAELQPYLHSLSWQQTLLGLLQTHTHTKEVP